MYCSFRASLSKIFNRTPSPNRKSLRSEGSPSPKSKSRLSPLFGRNSAPPSTGSASSDSTITKSICPASSSPKLFDKSERTFNIPASLVLRNNDVNPKVGNSKEREIFPGNISTSTTANQEKTEEISKEEDIASIPSHGVKPPRPTPRAINQQGTDIIEKCRGKGMQNMRSNNMIHRNLKFIKYILSQ